MVIKNRPRRLRENNIIRSLVRETRINIESLIYPLFVTEGKGIKSEIPSMPGIYHLSIDCLLKELDEIQKLGINTVLLFGVTDIKDDLGSGAYCEGGIIQKALREAKKHFPDMIFIADVCLCSYTSHGHCGIVKNGIVLNDESTELIVKASLSYADAGADIIAPSDMMDGRVREIRSALDMNNHSEKSIMAYSIKYASSFYGPFRDAAHSAPAFGDRKTYQMDFSNIKEAIREAELDISEGADIIMIKPALAYLDIIKEISSRFNVPVAAYSVSGEYSMIKAASYNGWINEKYAVIESITSIKRAGADIIITYFAKDIAKWLKK